MEGSSFILLATVIIFLFIVFRAQKDIENLNERSKYRGD